MQVQNCFTAVLVNVEVISCGVLIIQKFWIFSSYHFVVVIVFSDGHLGKSNWDNRDISVLPSLWTVISISPLWFLEVILAQELLKTELSVLIFESIHIYFVLVLLWPTHKNWITNDLWHSKWITYWSMSCCVWFQPIQQASEKEEKQ